MNTEKQLENAGRLIRDLQQERTDLQLRVRELETTVALKGREGAAKRLVRTINQAVADWRHGLVDVS